MMAIWYMLVTPPQLNAIVLRTLNLIEKDIAYDCDTVNGLVVRPL